MNVLESFLFFFSLAILSIIVLLTIIYIFLISKNNIETNSRKLLSIQKLGLILMMATFFLLSADIITRAVITGHGPFSSMFEFALAFTWGIIGMGLIYWRRYHIILISTLSNVIALALLIYASIIPSKAVPLVPALQQSLLLSCHVTAAVISYAAFCIGFVSAILYLIKDRYQITWLPRLNILDQISYHTVIVGFPLLTMVIILGAIWANIAWGKYWSWDPKETASLVTWLFYAGYLHSRLLGNWKGKRSAILLIIAFLSVVFTFLGNYVFNGLHSYG